MSVRNLEADKGEFNSEDDEYENNLKLMRLDETIRTSHVQ
jgi:hypothetical protein